MALVANQTWTSTVGSLLRKEHIMSTIVQKDNNISAGRLDRQAGLNALPVHIRYDHPHFRDLQVFAICS